MSGTTPGKDGRSGVVPPAFNVTSYDRRPELTDAESAAMGDILSNVQGFRWGRPEYRVLDSLLHPVSDALDFAGCGSSETRAGLRWRLLVDMHRRGRAYWGWSQDEWVGTLRDTRKGYRPHGVAAAYLLGGIDGPRALDQVRRGTDLARRVLGRQAVDAAIERVHGAVAGWGYDRKRNSLACLTRAVCHGLVIARSSRLEDLAAEHLEHLLRAASCTGHRSAIALLSRVLASMGIISEPIERNGQDGDRVGRAAAAQDAPEGWPSWCERWLKHSTLRSRREVYRNLLKAGRWLAARHPEVETPERWDAELAVEFVAVVDGMKTGDWCPSWAEANPNLAGKPMRPSAKSDQLYALRRFFRDLQEWGWIPVRFNPDRCLRTPRSIANLLGPDPKPIDAHVWAKLVKAALELEAEDFGKSHDYPIEMDRTLAALWVCSGLRSDEIYRLRVGCVRWQRRDVKVRETGEVLGKDSVCFLDVPVNKTSTAFTKPVPPVVGQRIEEWERARAADQDAALDDKTGEIVQFLFSHRNRRPGKEYLNQSLISALCRKAGVPREDSRGRITSHRARATVASQLTNAPDPWNLTEIQAFLGHTNPSSTRYYVELDLTRLAKKFADSGYLEKNLATVEVLLDVEALTSGENGQALYYELGHGLCANPYWHKCPYRMACVKCPMYVPGEEAQYVRAKQGVRRMLETIPLTDEERRAAQGDEEALSQLLGKSESVPVPANIGAPGQTMAPLLKKNKKTPDASRGETR